MDYERTLFGMKLLDVPSLAKALRCEANPNPNPSSSPSPNPNPNPNPKSESEP